MAENLQCIGTSATLAAEGAFAEQQLLVAEVASKLFGSPVAKDCVIGETLQRVAEAADSEDPDFVEALTVRVRDADARTPRDFDAFRHDPLCRWIKSTMGRPRRARQVA